MLKQSLKIQDFERELKSFSRVVVCLSGGVDSCVLLALCVKNLGSENVKAFVGTSRYMIASEIDCAKQLCSSLGVEAEFCDVGLAEITNANPQNRCYLCKKNIFSLACAYAKSKDISFVLDGTNFDDLQQNRLGNIAKDELGIKSPFATAQIDKAQIREIAEQLGLQAISKKNSATCLMTRFQVGASVNESLLTSIEIAEQYLKNLGFSLVRVRHYGSYVQVQVASECVEKLLEKNVWDSVVAEFRKIGFLDVKVAKDGYKFGCMQKE